MIKSKLKLKVVGLNQRKLVLAMQEADISLFDLEFVSHNEMVFTIDKINHKKLLKISKSMGVKTTIIEGISGWFFISKILLRFGILVGVIVTIISAFYLNGFITKIDYEIDGDYDKISAICDDTLRAINIYEGAKVTSITTREIEKYLQAKIEDASVVVVSKLGRTLTIQIKQGEVKRIVKNENIVALENGKIESITDYQGKVKVDIGDYVKRGDILIESGAVGDVYQEAGGKILARVFIEEDASGSLNYSKLVRSGNTYKTSSITFNSHSILKAKSSPFDNYEISENKTKISDLLPLYKCEITYYELDYKEVLLNYDELIDNLKEKAYNKAKERLGESEELAVNYFVYNEGDSYRVICSIETIKNIAG